MSGNVSQFLTILTIGVIGGIIYTLATHTSAIDAAARGVDNLYKTATGATLGQVA
jgi:hypothetical protein